MYAQMSLEVSHFIARFCVPFCVCVCVRARVLFRAGKYLLAIITLFQLSVQFVLLILICIVFLGLHMLLRYYLTSTVFIHLGNHVTRQFSLPGNPSF